jgi:hypothetical protein
MYGGPRFLASILPTMRLGPTGTSRRPSKSILTAETRVLSGVEISIWSSVRSRRVFGELRARARRVK